VFRVSAYGHESKSCPSRSCRWNQIKGGGQECSPHTSTVVSGGKQVPPGSLRSRVRNDKDLGVVRWAEHCKRSAQTFYPSVVTLDTAALWRYP
jgi:hypothetical protein